MVLQMEVQAVQVVVAPILELAAQLLLLDKVMLAVVELRDRSMVAVVAAAQVRLVRLAQQLLAAQVVLVVLHL
jgi:hypothetical protein